MEHSNNYYRKIHSALRLSINSFRSFWILKSTSVVVSDRLSLHSNGVDGRYLIAIPKDLFHWHENYELKINVIDQQSLILSTLKTLLDNGIFPKWSTQLSLNSANLTNHWSLVSYLCLSGCVERHWSATQEITSSNNDKWFFVTEFNKLGKSI